MEPIDPTITPLSRVSEELGIPISFECDLGQEGTAEPVTITMTVGQQSVVLPAFAERYQGKSGARADVEIAGAANLRLVFGRAAVVVISATEAEIVTVIDLLRDPKMDLGFASAQIFDLDAGALIVYEGGVVRLADDGSAVWHVKKYWDDHLVDFRNGYFCFEGDHAAYKLDFQTGLVLSD